MKTYIERCKEKTIEVNEKSFDDFVEYWHTSEETRNITLHEAIGISSKEYGQYILDSHKMLELIKNKIETK